MSQDQDKIIDLCRRLVGLNDDPHPGIGMWHVACERLASELRVELNKGEEDKAPIGLLADAAWLLRTLDETRVRPERPEDAERLRIAAESLRASVRLHAPEMIEQGGH